MRNINCFCSFILILSLSILTGCLDDSRGDYSIASSPVVEEPEPEPEPTTPVRPSNAITYDEYCVCQNGEPVIINNCKETCANAESTDSPTLFVTLGLGVEIKEDTGLGDFYGWCKNSYGDSVAPNCAVVVSNVNGVVAQLSIDEPTSGINKFTVNLDGANLTENKEYKVQLVEIDSKATADGYMTIVLTDLESDALEPQALTLEPITLYSCVSRAAAIEDGDVQYTAAVKMNFYFPSSTRPEAMDASEQYTLCHDPHISGQEGSDSKTYARLFETPNALTLWRKNDTYFTADTDESDKYKINTAIRDELIRQGYTASTDFQLFGPLNWPTKPTETSTSSDSSSADSAAVSADSNISTGTLQTQGFYMKPWITDDSKQTPYCPNASHLGNSDDPTFRILGGFIDETEAIYMALRESEEIIIEDTSYPAPDDILLLRESILSQIWFYIDYSDGNKKIKGSAESARNNTMMFYWPPQFTEPTSEPVGYKPSLYTVKLPSDIGTTTGSNTSDVSTIPTDSPTDNRFGCIPKTALEIDLPEYE